MFRRLALLTVGLLALLLTAAVPASLAPGAVVGLAGTPHLWIADDQGVLHWGGDTRALSGKHVNWSDRRDVSLAELQTFPIGDPWLSAGLLKDGDPIYLVKWETEWPQPQLLHIQSIKDVELFGIDGGNYGNFVLDKSTWEQRYGIAADTLSRSALARAIPSPVPAVTPSGAAATAWVNVPVVPRNTVHRFQDGAETWEVTVLGSVRGPAFADRLAQHKRSYTAYRPPPANQEDIGVHIRVRFVSSSKLGDDYGLLTYASCASVYGPCATHGPFELAMQRGGIGEYQATIGLDLGAQLVRKPGVYAGEEKTGWQVWRVWRDEAVVLILKLGDDQNDLASYTAVFAID